MDTERILFLVVGVVVVIAVGRLIALSGRKYLANSVPAEQASAGSSAVLVAVMFHLVTLGIVALLSVLSFGGNPVQAFVVRMGILLLVLAVTFGATLMMLNRRREQALAAEVDAGRIGDPAASSRAGVERADPAFAPRAGAVGLGGSDVPEGARRRPVDPSAGPSDSSLL